MAHLDYFLCDIWNFLARMKIASSAEHCPTLSELVTILHDKARYPTKVAVTRRGSAPVRQSVWSFKKIMAYILFCRSQTYSSCTGKMKI